MIQSPLEPRMAKLKVDPLTWRKYIWHITDILRGFNIVDGYAAVPLDAFYIPDHSVFGGQYPDIGGLATTFRK
jgi:hypothetical protein